VEKEHVMTVEHGMTWVFLIMALVLGFFLGLATAFVLRIVQGKTAERLAAELFEESEARRRETVDTILNDMKSSFGSLSLDALGKATEEFLKLAKSTMDSERQAGARELDAKKGLIDEQLRRMSSELERVGQLMQDLEKDRVEKFGALASQLESAERQTTALMQTTHTLREALASTKARGQWGERMAEDVLTVAGFVENVNYLKQKSLEGAGTRPDFTFLLPKEMRLHMDVKFPLDNYMRYLEADSDMERERHRNHFLKDVRARLKEVTTREYINPDQNTLDYVLLFIPNEQVYAFIHEQDSSMLDEGIRNRVILCSPLTLFAVLGVIRQSMDNFALEQTSNEILSLLGAFKKQWDAFVGKFDQLGKRLSDAQKEYEALTTTRRRQLDRPLDKLEALRTRKQIPEGGEGPEDSGSD
jgi:DNA recombination protein RmuC